MENPPTTSQPILSFLSIAATVFGVFMFKYGPASLGTALFCLGLPVGGFILAIVALIARERPRPFAVVALVANIASFAAVWFRGV